RFVPPCNGILGFAQLLKTRNIPSDQKDKYIDIIYNRGSHMLNVINNIIDISKIETSQLELEAELYNLNEELDEIYSYFYSNHALKTGINFNLNKELPDEQSNVFIDSPKYNRYLQT
ncbi:MAG: hypothetical protein HC896_12775, partial [Bacteroidales bacterium]|nr:hypothetical protein [Bacteroidales bacterium]